MAKKTRTQTNNNNRERGKAFERKMAKFLRFFRVPYSGSSVVFGEGDIRDHKDPEKSFYMGECKTMTPKSVTEVNYIIKAKWLEDLEGRAKRAGNLFRFLVFTKIRSPKAYAIVSIEDFKMLQQSLDIIRNWTGPITKEDLAKYVEEEWVKRYGTATGETEPDESGDDEG